MLKTSLTHPEILLGLASAGHGSLVLIADGNYPTSTTQGSNAAVVHLNLTRGVLDAVTVLRAVAGAVPVEAAFVMAPLRDGPYALAADPPIWAQFSEVLAECGSAVDLEPVERMSFYDRVATPSVALVIVTGEGALYANLLLRIGVVQGTPDSEVDHGAD